MEVEDRQRLLDGLHRFIAERRLYLIAAKGPYYVQFVAGYPPGWTARPGDEKRSFAELFAEMGLLSEAVSDQGLGPSDRLGIEGARRLTTLGWASPQESSNWSRVFDLKEPSDYYAICDVVTATFADGYRIRAPTEIEFGEVVPT